MRLYARTDIMIDKGTLPAGRIIRLTNKKANEYKERYGDQVLLITTDEWMTGTWRAKINLYTDEEE